MMSFVRESIAVVLLLCLANNGLSHEEGSHISDAMIDPIRVHHAHIEDKQRLNLSFIKGHENEAGNDVFLHSVELAFRWTDDFRWGSEILIPYANTGGMGEGFGDIDLQVIKYAFVNQPESILTAVFGMELPTGSKSRGLGGKDTSVEAALFSDQAYGNWYWGLNLEFGTVVDGEDASEFELATALAYSFLDGEKSSSACGVVPALLFEFVSETPLSGPEEGIDVATVVPGFHLWFPDSDLSLRFGVELPVTTDKENDRVFLLQFGSHRSWSRLFESL